MNEEKTSFKSIVIPMLVFIILVALGISGWQSYATVTALNNFNDKYFEAVTANTDDEGNKFYTTFNMNVYDYTDAVLVNIPIGSNDVWLDGGGKDWNHEHWNASKVYLKFSKDTKGSLTFDGVICYSRRNSWGNSKWWIGNYDTDSNASKELSHKVFEYIFTDKIEDTSWDFDTYQSVVDDYETVNASYTGYKITFAPQTDEDFISNNIFNSLYKQINTESSSLKYDGQLLIDSSLAKVFKNNECINSQVVCHYTRTINMHTLPTELDLDWFNAEIGG